MFRQVITELTLLKAEEAARHRSSDDDDDDDDDGDDDDGDDNGDGETAHSKDLLKFGRYSIPDNGYDEDEDCINAEDEEYLQYVRENKVRLPLCLPLLPLTTQLTIISLEHQFRFR